jgi:tetratricopeptide (TPR) repeat protein
MDQSRPGRYQYDLFVSHASEDKAEAVEPLVAALEERRLRVWYDRQRIKLGDDFRRSMDRGLAGSRFSVVVLSPSFAKFWTEAELSAVWGQESAFGDTRILPVRHQISTREVTRLWPLLATRVSISTDQGIDAVAAEIEAVVRGAPEQPAGASRMYSFPFPSQEFVGRGPELDQLAEMLRGDAPVRITAAVEGLAGVGKSELALQLAHRLAGAGDFPGGIFWLDAEGPDLTGAWGGAIADELGVAALPLAERASLVVRQLSRTATPVLVILDNVNIWSREQQPGPLPGGTHVRLLVTTRQRNLGGTSFRHMSLGFLEPDHARQLLLKLCERDPEQLPGLDDLLDHLQGHALAVELAGVYLKEVADETPAGYRQRLQQGKRPGDEVSDLVRYQATAHQAFTTIWQRLEPPVRRAWQVAACFAPEERSSALLDACGIDSRLRRELARFHLLETTGPGRWRMHRLLHEFGRRVGTEEEQAAASEAFVRGCVEHSKGIDIDIGFRIYLPDRPHFDRAVRMAVDVLKAEDEIELLINVGSAIYSAGDFRSSKGILQQALLSALQNLGEDHPSVARSRSNLALVLQDLGELELARELLEQALSSDLQNLGEDHPRVATRRSNLALVLQDLGELEPARELLEQALSSDLQNYGEDHPSVATIRSNLAVVLKGLGELEPARELLEQALSSALQNLGEEHPSVATRRSRLAGVLQALGELVPARELQEQALSSYLQNLGEDHPFVATSRINLATICEEDEAWEDAEAYYRSALVANLHSLGSSNPAVAYCRARLAAVLRRLGQTDEAEAEAKQALAIVAEQPTGSRFRVLVERSVRGFSDTESEET